VLQAPSLGLTNKQVRMLMMSIDDAGSAQQTLPQLLPLLDVLEEFMLAERRRHDLGEVGKELQQACAEADSGSGQLSVATLKELILKLFQSLSHLQVTAIMGEAKPDAAGLVAWEPFLSVASLMIRRLIDDKAIAERAKIAMRASFEPVELMDGRDADMMHQMLLTLFQEHDTDGNGSLDVPEFEECLQSTSLGFSPEDIQVLMQSADVNEDGRVTYEQFTELAYDVLLYVARERAIQAAMEKDKAAEKMQAIAKGRNQRKRQATGKE